MTHAGPLALARVDRLLADAVHAGPQPHPVPTPVADLAWAMRHLPPGGAVLIALPNGADLLAVLFAALQAGAVPVPISASAPPARIQDIAHRIGAVALAVPRSTTAAYARSGRSLGPRVHLHTLPAALDRPGRYQPGQLILMTSGTSGIATGCLHVVDSLLRNAARHAAAIGQRPGDRVLVNLPLHYSYALVAQAFAALQQDATLVLSGPPFTAPAYRDTVRVHGVTVSSLTPVLVRALGTDGGPRLPSTLRTLTVGGEALPPEDTARILRDNPGLELYLTYGLTEAGPRVSTLAAHEEPDRAASVGRPLPGVEVSLRREDPGDRVGELVIDTDTALLCRVGTGSDRGERVPGGIRTGDLFEIDPDEYLYFRGRLTDFIVVHGEKVALPSVRATAERLPGVVRATTRVHRAADGTRFALSVFVAGRTAPTAEDIRRDLRRVLLRAEQPDSIEVHTATAVEWHK
ncbi:class I adenylate-forming enzyme family protein [Dactylosporangium sp. NPDC051485]|uniref:class I adenylate-forming enzyme family protein n=1 Tax=Dactylosporangium sp. NPDC051485 TaxID=3154846 RepID=UPI00343FC46D